MTNAELLALVETAITSVLSTGQSVSALGQTWQKADLPVLYKMRADLTAQIAAGSVHPLRRAWAGTVAR